MSQASQSSHLTTGEVARIFGVGEWRIRRIVDLLPGVERAGLYRLVPRSLLPEIGAKLKPALEQEAKLRAQQEAASALARRQLEEATGRPWRGGQQ